MKHKSPSPQADAEQMQDIEGKEESTAEKISYGLVKQVETQLTKDDVIRLLSNVDETKYHSLNHDQITIANHSLGYFNTVWLVTIGEKNSLDRLIFKFYGGNKGAPVKKQELFDHGYDVKLETAIAKLASTHNIGPRVYYADDECRIEEFLGSQMFTQDTFFITSIANDFAFKLAQFHCLINKIDFTQYQGHAIDVFTYTRDRLTSSLDKVDLINTKVIEKMRSLGSNAPEVKGNVMLNELKYLEEISKKLKLKRVLINWDMNPLNIMIQSDVDDSPLIDTSDAKPTDDGKASESMKRKIFLIDYEYAHPNYRAIDLGSIIHGAIMQPLTGKSVTDEHIDSSLDYFEKNFLQQYYSKFNEADKNSAHPGDIDTDSWNNLLIEAMFGSCFIWIHYIAVRIDALFVMCADAAADSLANEVALSLQFYNVAKKRLFKHAPHLLADGEAK